ncbi:hypothetical protein HU200_051235 [Digitaria exilis]|uniref:TF-B3 domain-containing protein n=1 Tax=Digitaria exilis TaxID=1010633 RepID=A0A835AQT9_9POAL|nr:hypothetical protein HU200_051235 [Digitaria exilis]CAB3480072.1 unnamed protein product [Digitaria exilis]
MQEEEQEDDLLCQQQAALGQDLQLHHGGGGGEPSSSSSSHAAVLEREHMFDKVLTPSDVGKLNRLVVPKQHAERFFPATGGGAAAGGTQLCFEDRGGVPWRFRYSYWGSSQSYVMTKGWSRFVRTARLAAGDTVSFSRGGGGGTGRYFIDYRHCQRRSRDISFGDAAAAAVPVWPMVVGVQRTAAAGGGATTTATAVSGGHGVEVGPTAGARSFRLFGFNVECGGGGDAVASASDEVEYVDGDG